MVDAAINLSAATQNCQVFANINVGETAADAFADADWTRDDIIWTGAWGVSADSLVTQIVGTESNDTSTHAAVAFHHGHFELDIRAQRILRDTLGVFLNIANLSTPTGAVDIRTSYAVRALWKE